MTDRQFHWRCENMRTPTLAFALLSALSVPVIAADQNTPLNIDPLSSVSETQPQRVAWENKSDSLSVVPATADPLKNNFAAEKAQRGSRVRRGMRGGEVRKQCASARKGDSARR